MFKRNIQGAVGAIEIILVVVVLAVAGFVVWRVVSTDEEATVETTTEETTNDTADVSEDTEQNADINTEDTASDSEQVIALAETWCVAQDQPCEATIVDITEKYAVANTGSFRLLFVKDDAGTWTFGLASEEENICDTGSGHSGLIEYCASL